MSDNGAARLWSFKDIDMRHGCPKGSAFKAFKSLGPHLVEGRHYLYLDAGTQGEEIAELRREGRLYAATINAVLLTEAGYEMVRRALASRA